VLVAMSGSATTVGDTACFQITLGNLILCRWVLICDLCCHPGTPV